MKERYITLHTMFPIMYRVATLIIRCKRFIYTYPSQIFQSELLTIFWHTIVTTLTVSNVGGYHYLLDSEFYHSMLHKLIFII